MYFYAQEKSEEVSNNWVSAIHVQQEQTGE